MAKKTHSKYKLAPQKSSRKRAVILVVCAVLFCLVLVAAFVKVSQKPNNTPSRNLSGTTGSAETKGETSPSSSKPEASTPTAVNSPTKNEGEPTKPSNLVAPSGNFVSSHYVNIGDGGSVASTCNTSVGASCKITFTSGSMTKSLPVKMADSGGAAYWNWTPKSLGLTPGSWRIEAMSSLGQQQQSTLDALNLEIKE